MSHTGIRFNTTEDERVVLSDAGVEVYKSGVRLGLALRSPPQPRPTPPETDNTPAARAARAPFFILASTEGTQSSDVDDGARLKTLLQAIFAVMPSEEWISLEIPESTKTLHTIRSQLMESGLAISSPHTSTSLLLLREGFWQGALAPIWYPHPRSSDFPLIYTYTAEGRRHPVRQPKPAAGTIIYERFIPHLEETFTLRIVDPSSEHDVDIFSSWQNSPRVAAAWAQTGTLEEHRTYLEKQTSDNHQLPIIGSFNGADCLYTELYWLPEDALATHLDRVNPYDRGFHILVGSEDHRGPHRVQAWASSIVHALFLADSRTQRVVMEPRLSNTKIINYMCSSVGFAVTKHLDFPHKRSALLELSRERFFQLSPFHFNAARH